MSHRHTLTAAAQPLAAKPRTSVILKGFKPRRGNRKSAESAKRTANEISPKQFLIFW
jgi:hypothetical protein